MKRRKKKIELEDDVMFDRIPMIAMMMIHRGKGRLSLSFARRYTLFISDYYFYCVDGI